jgi:hypothetical protein
MCDSHDVVALDQELSDLELGELLLVPTMGAYTSARASGFNGLDMARLVEVDSIILFNAQPKAPADKRFRPVSVAGAFGWALNDSSRNSDANSQFQNPL